MGKHYHFRLAAGTAMAGVLFVSSANLQAQGGVFVPYIPPAAPVQQYKTQSHSYAQQIYQKQLQSSQRTQQARFASNGVRFQRAAFSNTRMISRQNGNQNAWQRVFNTFNMPDYSSNPRVRKFIRSYAKSPKQLSILSGKADTFLHMIIEEINRRGMPAEIALLPFVESGFDPDVFSHAGAAGLWQFIPSTGRNYGLKQTRNYDARMDPFAATGAALNYLQKLHREFRGDWLKALAAYNCGENCVHRAVRRAKNAGRSDSYWNLSLPRETMNYVPRLLAFKELISKSGQYGIRLPVTPNDAKLTQVRLNKPINLRQAALRAGLPANKLTELNPCFRTGITTPQHSNRIILPREHAGRLIQVLRTMPPA
ncbi:MAG: transglycosylase SLT domain-containing protein [Thiolinea sp.]